MSLVGFAGGSETLFSGPSATLLFVSAPLKIIFLKSYSDLSHVYVHISSYEGSANFIVEDSAWKM